MIDHQDRNRALLRFEHETESFFDGFKDADCAIRIGGPRGWIGKERRCERAGFSSASAAASGHLARPWG